MIDNLAVISGNDCSGLLELPYTKDFENDDIGEIPKCFTVDDKANYSNWYLNASVRTGTAYQGSNFLHFYAYGGDPANTNSWLFFPALNFTPGKTYKISFKYRGYNNRPVNDYPFEIAYGSAPNAISMQTAVGATTYWPNTYQTFEANFLAAANKNYIGLHFMSGQDWGNALYIDNLSIVEKVAPPCNLFTATLNAPCCTGGTITANASSGISSINWFLNGNMVTTQTGNWQENAVSVAGNNGNGNAANQLSTPFSVTADTTGNIYVADAGNHRVQKFTPGSSAGITVAGGNGSGSAANQLNNPRGVFIDKNGSIYVADAGNNRVQKWVTNAANGVTVAGGTGQGAGADQLDFPHGVFVDTLGNVYVADANNNRVQKVAPGSPSGVTVAGGNGNGTASNQLWYASAVYVDAAQNVYVNDFVNNRVQKWEANGVTGTTVAGGNGAGNAANQLNGPRSIYVDCRGDVYVADQNNHRIQKWSPGVATASTIAGGNEAGSGPGQLNSPAALNGDSKGNLYVADRLNHRVQQFTLSKSLGYTPMQGGAYKAQVNGGACCTVTTPQVVINPTSGSPVCPGSNTLFASGNSTPGNTYQWQENSEGSYVFLGNNAIYSGTGSDTLILKNAPLSMNGYKFRCLINGTTYSPEYTLKFEISWTGNASTAWENPANWNCGVLPDGNTDVVINSGVSNFPQVNFNAACGSLKLMPGATVTVKTGMKLDIKRRN
ncbi:MAG: hypothetical protein V4722_25300 [Bacteroidota bacterium]